MSAILRCSPGDSQVNRVQGHNTHVDHVVDEPDDRDLRLWSQAGIGHILESMSFTLPQAIP